MNGCNAIYIKLCKLINHLVNTFRLEHSRIVNSCPRAFKLLRLTFSIYFAVKDTDMYPLSYYFVKVYRIYVAEWYSYWYLSLLHLSSRDWRLHHYIFKTYIHTMRVKKKKLSLREIDDKSVFYYYNTKISWFLNSYVDCNIWFWPVPFVYLIFWSTSKYHTIKLYILFISKFIYVIIKFILINQEINQSCENI